MIRRRTTEVPDRAPTGTTLVDAAALDVHLQGVEVLHDVSLSVRAGEMVALVGPNGAGKSTLLAALAGDVATSAGTIEVHARPMSAWSAVELALRRAVLPQQILMSFPFTVRDVVRMGRAPWARTERANDDDVVVATALAETDTEHLGDRLFTTLSGGERARVALARVMAQVAQVVLLDEPTAALDVRHQELVFELARRWARAGDAVVVVVHDLGLAVAYADRVVVMADGSVVADGPTTSVIDGELLTSVYRHEIEVIRHPSTGAPIVLPLRTTSAVPAGAYPSVR